MYQCFCGYKAPSLTKLLPKSDCNLACSGDSSKKCGGSWKMNVYKRTDYYYNNAPQVSLNGKDPLSLLEMQLKANCQDQVKVPTSLP